MRKNKEITNQIVIKTLAKLITDCTRQLDNTPDFLEQERKNLTMEIKDYKRHLLKIQGVQG